MTYEPLNSDFGTESLSSTNSSASSPVTTTSLESPPKTPSIEVKSYVGNVAIQGGRYLQSASDGLSKAMAPINKLMEYYFPEEKKIAKQQLKVDAATKSIQNESTNINQSQVLREKMIHGQNLCTRAVFFNTALAVIGGAGGCFAGMMLSHVGGMAGAVLGAAGGAFIGTVGGHLAGKGVASYLLKGMGFDEDSDEHKNVKLLVTISFGAVGGLIGFGSGLVGGGTLGTFLGEVCIVGGLTKAGLGLGWLLGSATLGGYLDAHGKAYQEAVKDFMKEENFNYTGAPIAPSIMDKAAETIKTLSNITILPKPTDTTPTITTEEPSSNQNKLISNMNKLLGMEKINPTASIATTDTTSLIAQPSDTKGGSCLQSLNSTCNSIFQTLVTGPGLWLNEKLDKMEEHKTQVREARQERYDTWTGATARAQAPLSDNNISPIKYHGGAALCALSISGRILADLAGIGGGLIAGAHILALTSPYIAASALASAVGGGIEGAVVGFAGGYLLAEWLSGSSSMESLIEMEFTQEKTKQEQEIPPNFKNTSEYKEFKKSKMELYNQNLDAYEKAKNAVWTGVALSMGVVGGLIGMAGCAVLKGSLQAFITKAAILGGSVKLTMIAFDYTFGAGLHHTYCLGSALEKANAPEAMIEPKTLNNIMNFSTNVRRSESVT